MTKENAQTHDTQTLAERLIRITHLLNRSHQRMHSEHGPFGNPHRGQGRLLKLLKMHPQISQKDLSYLLDMRAQSMGELLSKLEKAGFIERTPSGDDRRSMDISLTKAGEKAADQIQMPHDFSRLFDGLSDEDQKAFGGFLDQIIFNLEKEFEGDEDHGDPHDYERPDRFSGPRGHMPPHLRHSDRRPHRHGRFSSRPDEE